MRHDQNVDLFYSCELRGLKNALRVSIGRRGISSIHQHRLAGWSYGQCRRSALHIDKIDIQVAGLRVHPPSRGKAEAKAQIPWCHKLNLFLAMGISLHQSKCEDTAGAGKFHILFAADHIRHRRCPPWLAGLKVPKRLSGVVVHGGESSSALSKEDQSAGSRQGSRATAQGQLIIPRLRPSLNIDRSDKHLAALAHARTSKEPLAHVDGRWILCVQGATVGDPYVEQLRYWIVGGGGPVRSSANAGANQRSFQC